MTEAKDKECSAELFRKAYEKLHEEEKHNLETVFCAEINFAKCESGAVTHSVECFCFIRSNGEILNTCADKVRVSGGFFYITVDEKVIKLPLIENASHQSVHNNVVTTISISRRKLFTE